MAKTLWEIRAVELLKDLDDRGVGPYERVMTITENALLFSNAFGHMHEELEKYREAVAE